MHEMKAIVCTKYGPPEVLELREVEKPQPKKDEVLIKVYATTVTTGECEIRGMKLPLWLRFPMQLWLGFGKPKKILGQELSGKIEETGKEVTQFKAGDKVFGTTGFNLGAYAQYVCLPVKGSENALALKPDVVTFEQAAALPVGGLEALHFISKANIQTGQKVLIVGAGGSIGTFAIQLAKQGGAEVTGVDSTEKLDTLRQVGAANTIDYTQEDFTKNGETYDVIFDVAGKSSFSATVKSLKPIGILLMANPKLSDMLRARWTSMRSGKRIVFGSSSQNPEDLKQLVDLLASGELKTVIDRTFRLEDIVEAHHYVESGHKKGNVVVKVSYEQEKTA